MNSSAFSKKFIQVHIAAMLFLALATVVFVTHLDAMRIFEYPWSQTGPRHQNVTLQKFEMMQRYPGAQAVVLGSSTSENYLPVDVQRVFGFKTFHGMVAGSQALAKLALLKQAVQQYPDLKLVVFVADFYETNDNAKLLFNHEVTRSSRLSALIPAQVKNLLPFELKTFFWDIFSNQVIESAFKQLKIQSGRKKLDYFRDNGTVATTSEVASVGFAADFADAAGGGGAAGGVGARDDEGGAASAAGGGGGVAGRAISDWLRQKIEQNWLQYKSGALGDYEFSERVIQLYDSFLSELAGKDLQIVIILSPLHPIFYARLQGVPALNDGFSQWRAAMKLFEKYPNVKVFDPASGAAGTGTGAAGSGSANLYLPDFDPYWRDGVHYNQDISAAILKRCQALFR